MFARLFPVGMLFLFYLLAPICAGIFEIGDKWGPKIYPIFLHENLYSLGWEMSSHSESKPRIGMWFDPSLRPWLYGMNSGNSPFPPPIASPSVAPVPGK